VMIGGLITSTLFTLLALPTFYSLVVTTRQRFSAGDEQSIIVPRTDSV